MRRRAAFCWIFAIALALGCGATGRSADPQSVSARGDAEQSAFRLDASSPLDLAVRLARRADAPFELGLGRAARPRLTIRREGASAAAFVVDGDRIVYPGAYPSTNIVDVAGPSRFEESYVLRDASAPRVFTWRVERGTGLPRVERDSRGGLGFFDRQGSRALRVQPPFAVDARGVRRDARLDLEGERLTVSIDTTGLAFPVVLDPIVDTTSGEWTPRTPAKSPPLYQWAAMAFDEARGLTIFFGGLLGAPVNDTWAWDGTNWTQLTPADSPPPRFAHALAYDSDRQVLVMFGGVDFVTGLLGDTWEFDGSNWKVNPAPAPPARRSPAMAYDRNRHVTVLFGGENSSGIFCDTWEWDGAHWADRTEPSPPECLSGAAAYFDGNSNVVQRYGGFGTTLVVSTASDQSAFGWWNGAVWSPVAQVGTVPPPRDLSTVVFDTSRRRAVLFGGEVRGVLTYEDTHEWDGQRWHPMSPDVGPGLST